MREDHAASTLPDEVRVRLYVQTETGEFGSVLDRVRDELRALAAAFGH